MAEATYQEYGKVEAVSAEVPRVEQELSYLSNSIERLELFVEKLENRLFRVLRPSDQPTSSPLTAMNDIHSELAADITRSYSRVNDAVDRVGVILDRLEL